jgi:hypothetical protein
VSFSSEEHLDLDPSYSLSTQVFLYPPSTVQFAVEEILGPGVGVGVG